MGLNTSNTPRLHLGAAYYPEHWPETRWGEDIQLMKEAGFTVVRMGEFAWSTLEISEGEFQLDWLERAIARLADFDILTVLGTPTAAPPAWLVQQYPDLLAVDEHGQRVQFGNRCHYCVNSPDFHTATQRIVEAMAKQYGANPYVIGWQLDNEYNRVCYCPRCQALFQNYLQEKFGTLDALNEAWSTRYWSQTYSDWTQIPIPIGPHNPGLMLEFKRFTTASYKKFQRLQLETLWPHLPYKVWVTHNFMGWYDGYDHYEMAEDLDLATWDWYVGSGHHDHLTSGASHDLTRGFKRQNFWVMETQPGSVNWHAINNSLNKGEGRAMAWHAVAHGADGILYWQWRSALNGQEQYHGSLVDQSGQPRPFYNEVQKIGQEFNKLSPFIPGTEIKATVALLNDYESRWSIQWQRHHRDFDYVKHFNSYYRPLAAMNVPIDILSAKDIARGEIALQALQNYKLIVAPALTIIDDGLFQALQNYVSNGGHLVLTIRSGMKDRNNALLAQRQPGPFAKLAAVEVEEYYALQEPVMVKGNWFEGQSQLWAERLKLIGKPPAPVIATYGPSNGWLDDQPAITVKTFGRGLIYYVGAYLDEIAQQALLTRFLKSADVTFIKTPLGIEVSQRTSQDGQEYYFIINHQPMEKTIYLPWTARDLIREVDMESELKLEPYGVAIVTLAKLTK